MSIFQLAGIAGRSKFRAAAVSICMVLAMLAPQAQAQEISAEHLAAARKALTASEATNTFDGILPAISNRIKSTLISSRPDLSDLISQIVDAKTLDIAVRRGDLEKEATLIFAKTFSIEELKVIADFYNSKAGKKFLNEAPVLQRQMREAAKIWEGGMFRDLTADVAKEMEDKGYN